MAKWKFHVILPNGDEYLTETLAEARALEAKHGRTGNHLLFHKRVEDEVPNPRKPAVAPAPAPAAPATLRKTPQKFVATEEVNRDPRLPPVGTVLAKQGLVVVFDVLEDTDVFHVVAPTRADMRGTYTSLSGLVRKFLRVANYNGFQFFGLLERLHSGSKYQVAQLGPKGLAIARSDQDMPVEDYAVTAEIEVEEPEGREGRKPLYGHDSEQTAYVVDGYPYGGYRTQIRYWLEHSPSKGWRFVSQTLNPKTLRWNAPKPSTYALVAGQMFLDDQQHVVWERLTEYSEADEVRQFLKDFPRTDKSMLEKWIPAKVAHYQKQVSMIGKGVSGWMIGGKPVPVESGDLEVAQRQLAAWQSAAEQLQAAKSYTRRSPNS